MAFKVRLGAATTRPIFRNRPKVGRNEKCPCGSRRKYKKCCGRPKAPAPQQQTKKKAAAVKSSRAASAAAVLAAGKSEAEAWGVYKTGTLVTPGYEKTYSEKILRTWNDALTQYTNASKEEKAKMLKVIQGDGT